MPQLSETRDERVITGIKLSNWASTQSSLRLPREIDQISAEFLTRALQERFPGIIVKDFRIPFIHHGFTTILRLELRVVHHIAHQVGEVEIGSRELGLNGIEAGKQQKLADQVAEPIRLAFDAFNHRFRPVARALAENAERDIQPRQR